MGRVTAQSVNGDRRRGKTGVGGERRDGKSAGLDPPGLDDLRGIFYPGLCLFLSRRLGESAGTRIAEEILQCVAGSLRPADFRRPQKLRAAIVEAARLRIASEKPRAGAEASRRAPVVPGTRPMTEYLRSLPAGDRAALARFYGAGETPEQICREMGISRAAFRALRAQARARFREI